MPWSPPSSGHPSLPSQPSPSSSQSRADAYQLAKHRLLLFMQEVSALKGHELRDDVVRQVEQLNRSRRAVPSYLSEEAVLRMVNARIDK